MFGIEHDKSYSMFLLGPIRSLFHKLKSKLKKKYANDTGIFKTKDV